MWQQRLQPKCSGGKRQAVAVLQAANGELFLTPLGTPHTIENLRAGRMEASDASGGLFRPEIHDVVAVVDGDGILRTDLKPLGSSWLDR